MHGWGLAVDLCGGVESFDTPEHAWMVDARAGVRLDPPVVGRRPGGSRPEPWHFEYDG